MSVTGLPGQGPVRVGIPVADLTAGLHLAQGILLALYERERSGEGQWVHTSLLEAQIMMLDFQAARWTVSGEVAPQAGNDHPTSIPTGVFPTSDGHINIAASGNTMFERLGGALGCPELVSHPDYADDESRSANRIALNKVLGEYTARRPSEEWVVMLNEARVPCGPINSIDKTMTDPQVRHLGIEKVMAHPELGDVGVVRPGGHALAQRWPPRYPHPHAGPGRAHRGCTGHAGLRRRSSRCAARGRGGVNGWSRACSYATDGSIGR